MTNDDLRSSASSVTNESAIKRQTVADYFHLCLTKGFDSHQAAEFRVRHSDPEFDEMARAIDGLMLIRADRVPDPEL